MTSKATCPKQTAEKGPALIQNGDIVLQAYQVGWLVSGFFAIVATVVSAWLVNKHLQWYTIKGEQRYIVRILFMVPIYALVSLASFLFWDYSTVLILVRDAYESTALTAFFYLLLMYISHDPGEQKALFLKVGLSREADFEARKKGEKPRRWMFPLGFIHWKPQDGLHFLQVAKWGVLQYCVIRPTTTLAAVILNYMGLYCEDSWGLDWGHVYISVITSISVTIAMYFLIQLYITISAHVAPRGPLLQLFAIKVVVFLTFWQSIFISLLTMLGVVKDSKYMTSDDVNVGIEAMLETFEMALIAFLHIRAYSYGPYVPFPRSDSLEIQLQRTPRLQSLAHSMNFMETIRELWIGWIYMWDKFRGREPTHDVGARRTAHYAEAFGRSRHSQPPHEYSNRMPPDQEATFPRVEIEVEERVDIEIEGEKQWLGLGDDYAYGLRYAARERSDSLGIQIEKELERRGMIIGPSNLSVEDFSVAHTRKQQSWWRRLYDRFSEHGSENEQKQTSGRSRDHHSQNQIATHVTVDNPASQGSHRAREMRNNDGGFSAVYEGLDPQVSSRSSPRNVRKTYASKVQAVDEPWPDINVPYMPSSANRAQDINDNGSSSVQMSAQSQYPEQSHSRHCRESAFHLAQDISAVISQPLATRAPPRGKKRRSDIQGLGVSGSRLQPIPSGPHRFRISGMKPSGSFNRNRSDNIMAASRRPRAAETYNFMPESSGYFPP